jgi:hypothetical protein
MTDSTQVRPFDWRDLPLLHRVRHEGLCFHSQMAFTRGPHALQNALLDSLTPGRSECTIVVRDSDDGAPDLIGQVSHAYQARVARLTFVGPAGALEAPAGTHLLEALAQSVGRRGAYNLVAEVDEHSPAFESLRVAGFAIYARQRVWRCLPQTLPASASAESIWEPERDADQAAILGLYQNLVPALVQQVEPEPVRAHKGLVYYEEGELLGYADIDKGALGMWLHPFIHPAVEESEALILGLLHAVAGDDDTRPVFLCVRSYQGWMNAKLGRMQIPDWADQAVMVKRLAALVRRPSLVPMAAFEGTRPEPTAPYAPVIDHHSVSRPQGTP